MRVEIPQNLSIALHIARAEIRSRYARSVLGSFWITLQLGLFVGVAGFVFPGIFGARVEEYVPFFAVSLLFWGVFSAAVIESQDALSANGPLIRDRGFSPEIFLYAAFLRNLVTAAHALVVPVFVIALFAATTPAWVLMALPGMLLFLVIAAAATYILGILGARFRDLKRACEALMQIAFLVTPILWQPAFAQGRSRIVLDINPLAHMFMAWRQPLLTGEMAWTSLGVAAGLALLSLLLALVLARRIPGLAIWI